MFTQSELRSILSSLRQRILTEAKNYIAIDSDVREYCLTEAMVLSTLAVKVHNNIIDFPRLQDNQYYAKLHFKDLGVDFIDIITNNNQGE